MVDSSSLEDIIIAISNRLFAYTSITNLIAGPSATSGNLRGATAGVTEDKDKVSMTISFMAGYSSSIKIGIRNPIDVTNLSFILLDISISGSGLGTSVYITKTYPETAAQVLSSDGRGFSNIGGTYCVSVVDLTGIYYIHVCSQGYHATDYTTGYGLVWNIRYV